jgi:selenide,water dikinase
MTDVTGFGILGHLIEMMEGSGLGATIHYNQLPILDAAKKYISQKAIPDATYRNWNAYNQQVAFGTGVNVMEAFQILPDPQTNGGLLIAIAPESLTEVQVILKAAGIENIDPIGVCTEAEAKRIQVNA